MSANTTTVTDANFETEVLKAQVPVIVDFWAEWCGPCKALAPTLDQVAAEYQGKVKVVKMDIDQNPNTPAQFGVRSIPTLILFKSGKQIDISLGNVPKTQLVSFVKKAIQ